MNQDLGFTGVWIQKTLKWVEASLKKSAARVRSKLQQKLRSLRMQRSEEVKNNRQKQSFVKKKVVYNNSSKVLTEEQLELLALGLNFGLAPRKFPLVEYVAATEDLCQKLEKIGDGESVEKARMIRNEVFIHLKKGYKMVIRNNLSVHQRKILQELKEDESIIICPADKGKAVVVEDRETYMAKTVDQIHEGNYELVNKGEKTILRKSHRNLMNQLLAMNIKKFQEELMCPR